MDSCIRSWVSNVISENIQTEYNVIRIVGGEAQVCSCVDVASYRSSTQMLSAATFI